MHIQDLKIGCMLKRHAYVRQMKTRFSANPRINESMNTNNFKIHYC